MIFSRINITYKRILLSPPLKNFISDVFYVAFFTYFVYLIGEILFEGLISNYFDLNKLLILVLFSGGLKFFSDLRSSQSGDKIIDQEKIKINLSVGILFAIIMALIIYFSLKSLGLMALIISGVALIAVYLALKE